MNGTGTNNGVWKGRGSIAVGSKLCEVVTTDLGKQEREVFSTPKEE